MLVPEVEFIWCLYVFLLTARPKLCVWWRKTTEVKRCSHHNTAEGHIGHAVSGHVHEAVPLVFPQSVHTVYSGKRLL